MCKLQTAPTFVLVRTISTKFTTPAVAFSSSTWWFLDLVLVLHVWRLLVVVVADEQSSEFGRAGNGTGVPGY
jgi:hypothetical protein